MSLTSYIAEIKEALGGLGVTVYEGPIARFESIRANSVHEAILVSDGAISEEPADDLRDAAALYGITIDIYTRKAPAGVDDSAIVRAREIFDDVFPAVHGLEPDGCQIMNIEAERMETEDYNDGHYQIRFNLRAQEYYGSCR